MGPRVSYICWKGQMLPITHSWHPLQILPRKRRPHNLGARSWLQLTTPRDPNQMTMLKKDGKLPDASKTSQLFCVSHNLFQWAPQMDHKPASLKHGHTQATRQLKTLKTLDCTPTLANLTTDHPLLPPMNEQPQCNKPLHIWQQNINKSLISQLNLLNNTDPKLFNFIFLQEPHIDFLNSTRANHQWTVVYPTYHHANPKSTRLVTLISTNISKNKWKQVHIQSNDVTAIELSGSFGTLTFYSVYNACKNADTLLTLQAFWMWMHPPTRMTQIKWSG